MPIIDFTLLSAEDPIEGGSPPLFVSSTLGAGARLVDIGAGVIHASVKSGAGDGHISFLNPDVEAYSDDQYCEVLRSSVKTHYDCIDPAVFCDKNNGYFIQFAANGADDLNKVMKVVAGVVSDVAGGSLSAVDQGADDLIGFRGTHSEGTTTLRVYLNPTTYDGRGDPTDGLVLTTTDASLSGGQPGLSGFAGDSGIARAVSMSTAGEVASFAVDGVDGDADISEGQTGIIITDSEAQFGAAQGTGGFTLGGIAAVSITNWLVGSITFDNDGDYWKYGLLPLAVTNDNGDVFDPIDVLNNPAGGISFLDLVDVSNTKVTGLPVLEVGFQLRHSSVTAVNGFPVLMDNTGNFTIDKSLNPTASLIGDSFDCAAFDGSAWGATATQSLFDPLAPSGVTIDETNVVVTHNRDIALGGGYSNSDFSLTIDGNARTVTSVSVVGSVHTFTYSGAAVVGGQTVLLSHVDPGDGVEAADDGEDLSDIVNFVVANSVTTDLPPTVVLSVAVGIKSGVFSVTAAFSEDVTGLLLSDFVVSGGAVDSLTPVSAQVYTLGVLPTAASEGSVTVDLPSGSVVDSGANGNVAADQLVVQYDTLAPSVILSTAAGTKAGQFTVDAVFPESVGDISPSDFSITKGTVDSVAGSGASQVATITPDVNDSGNVTLQLNADVVGDAAGNANLASAVLSIPFDTLLPSIVSVNAGGDITPGSTIVVNTIGAGSVAGVARLFRNNTHYPLAVESWTSTQQELTVPNDLPPANDYQLQLLFG